MGVAPVRNLRRDWGSREREGEGDAVRASGGGGGGGGCCSARASRARLLSLLLACWTGGGAYGLAVGAGEGWWQL